MNGIARKGKRTLNLLNQISLGGVHKPLSSTKRKKIITTENALYFQNSSKFSLIALLKVKNGNVLFLKVKIAVNNSQITA